IRDFHVTGVQTCALPSLGRFGGAELGFGSDADILYVFDANGVDPQRAQTMASQIVAGLREHLTDNKVPLDLDADLRPEGRNGPRSEERRVGKEKRSRGWE